MKIISLVTASLLIIFTLTRCETGRTLSSGLSVTGKIGEILVVCEQDIWNSNIQESLDSELVQYILPYLPDVATFQLTHRTPRRFSDGVKRFRNTLFLQIDHNYKGERGKVEKRLDVWAKGQIVIDITAKDYDQLLETCLNGLDNVHDEFDNKSWNRIMYHFGKARNETIKSQVRENFGLELVLPAHSRLVGKRKNFFRIEFPSSSRPIVFEGAGGSQDNGTIFSGIMIYQYDFQDSTHLEFDQLLAARDTMLRYNVPHEVEGMYMGTQYNEIVFPEGNNTKNYDGTIPGYEMRGMFMFKGLPKYSTGGAFWAFHFINPNTKKLMCVSGYVDAPSTTSWTHPLREVQAILRSVEFSK